jgi:hypothetical protein
MKGCTPTRLTGFDQTVSDGSNPNFHMSSSTKRPSPSAAAARHHHKRCNLPGPDWPRRIQVGRLCPDTLQHGLAGLLGCAQPVAKTLAPETAHALISLSRTARSVTPDLIRYETSLVSLAHGSAQGRRLRLAFPWNTMRLRIEEERGKRRVADVLEILSANSEGRRQCSKAGHTRLGARPSVQPVYDPQDVHRGRRTHLLEAGLQEPDIPAPAHSEYPHTL